MSKKTKTNIGMFLLSIILIAYGFILGRITVDDEEDEDWNIVLSFFFVLFYDIIIGGNKMIIQSYTYTTSLVIKAFNKYKRNHRYFKMSSV